MFWTAKRKTKVTDIHAMTMLKGNDSFSMTNLLSDFRKNYDHELKEASGDETAAAFRVDGDLFGIVHVKIPIPFSDIEWAAEVAFNWPTALDELKDHKGHVIITTFPGNLKQVERFKILTRLVFSLLRTSNALGVYKGNQRLLVSKDDYLTGEMILRNNTLPINLWVHFCLLTNKNGNSGFTFGMKEFNKLEMEINDSSKSLEEIRGFLYHITYYTLAKDVVFGNGSTFSADGVDRIPISKSRSELFDEETLKLRF
jgi:hypothetical protein